MDFLETVVEKFKAANILDRGRLSIQIFPNWIHSIVISEMNESTIAKLYDIKGHYERVQFFLSHDKIKTKMENSVKEYITDYQGKGRKNLEKSKIFIKHAKKMLIKKDLDQALDLYNKGILSTPFPVDETDIEHKERLSLLLNERSNIFKLMYKYYEACDDADDAIIYSHVASEAKKEYIKGKRSILRSVRPDVGPNSYNNKLNGAASYLKISYSAEKGRGIITTKEVKPDTVVIAEEPFVHSIIPSKRDSYCAHCLRSLKDRPFPCRGCVYLRFCSFSCSEEAWETYHAQECPHIAGLLPMSKGHHALRAFLTVGVDKALDIYCKSFKNKKTVDITKMQKFRNSLENILTLFGYEDTRADDSMIIDIGCAVFISIYAQTIGLITNDRLIDFASLAFKFLSIETINSYHITDDVYYDSDGDIRLRNYGDSKVIGLGIYATSSLVNHSCDQNCFGRFLGKKMITAVDKTIGKNQELTTSYVETNRPKEMRCNLLAKRYLFNCNCSRCKIEQ